MKRIDFVSPDHLNYWMNKLYLRIYLRMENHELNYIVDVQYILLNIFKFLCSRDIGLIHLFFKSLNICPSMIDEYLHHRTKETLMIMIMKYYTGVYRMQTYNVSISNIHTTYTHSHYEKIIHFCYVLCGNKFNQYSVRNIFFFVFSIGLK